MWVSVNALISLVNKGSFIMEINCCRNGFGHLHVQRASLMLVHDTSNRSTISKGFDAEVRV